MAGSGGRPGVGSGLALTFGSAVLWGLAHLCTGRRRTGALLMAADLTLVTAGVTALLTARPFLLGLAVQPGWLTVFSAVALLFALATVAVVIRSYQLVRPRPLTGAAHYLSTAAVGLLCVLVVTPMAYAARLAYVSQNVMASVFGTSSTPVPADPWRGRERINILLIGGDAAPSRAGVRTDSITVASVDTRTGKTLLFGLPRNLQRVPMPIGPARDRFPYGFGGEPPLTPAILNEVWQYAEDHPEIVPGVVTGERGPALLKKTVGGILGLDVAHYAMVDMRGFARIVDALGGVRITVREPIVYGRRNEGLIQAGTRTLSGEEALWYGRSRTYSSDYVRMSRQKCLMNALAKQADPVRVIRSFERLATATANAVSTDIPQELLPALVGLAGKVRGAEIESLQFVPPMIDTNDPDYDLIKEKVTAALAGRPAAKPATATRRSPVPAAPGAPAGASASPQETVALGATCG
ncbi:LCP family protein [Planomonospora sp. ID67723]|uniref:LCP family protein n=1 Tax=Planomonospora sp. ID67723 TaxID=2738134 RepID=UPI0018C3C2D6|nr:LCP family protein [Planomonospora sp. ID67723]MBG0826867.1 LCP family protein [Planomonospora sp. ID67723]